MKFLLLPFILAGLIGCSHGGKRRHETFVPLSKDVVDLVSQATFEVVVAKETNTSLIFDQDPMEDLPFQKKGDAYVSIGTAFLIGPNRFVSTARVLQVDSPSLLSVLKLRDNDGKIYTPNLVTRCSNFRNLIEFQVDQPDDSRKPLEISSSYSPGQKVFAVGNIDGDGITYLSAETLQSISEPTEGRWKYIRYYSSVLGGALGGPLVNDKGQVLGVLTGRNEKEKINFVIPISQLTALPIDHAEFYRKKMIFHALPKAAKKDWIFSPSLPKNIEILISEARASLSDLVKTGYAEIAADKDKNYFPKQEGFRSYLRTQEMGSNLGVLTSDPYGSHWRLQEFKPGREKELKADVQIKDYANRGYIPVIAYLPVGEKIEEFNADPAKVATTMIVNDSLGAFSKTGNGSYLTSVGKPDHVSTLSDHLGRTWTAARWYYHDANFALSTTCTPVPEGSACIVRIGNYASIALEDDFMSQFLDCVMVAYRGTLIQWKNYMNELNPKLTSGYLPTFLSDAKIDFVASKNVDVHVGHFAFNFPSPKIDNDSRLIVKMGYDPNQELASTVLGVDLIPGAEEKEWFGMENRYVPTEDAAEGRHSNWKKLSGKNPPYDGIPEVTKNKEAKHILKVFELHPKTETQIESATVAICVTPLKRPDEELAKACDVFIQSLGSNSTQ
jgi:serine protease Do